MSSKRGRNRNSGAVSDKRENDKKGSPEKSKSESEKPEVPTVFEHETEDGLKVKLDPFEAEISREYELSENDIVEFSAGIDWSPTDFKLERIGGGVSLSGEVGLPGDLLGVSGGILVDLATGEIIGGELGVEFGGADVEFSVSGEDACQKSISVSFLGVGVSYTRDDCEDDRKDKEDNDDKWPSGDDIITDWEEYEEIIERFSSSLKLDGCSGIVRFWVHDWWRVLFEISYPSIIELNLATGKFQPAGGYNQNDVNYFKYELSIIFGYVSSFGGPGYMYIKNIENRKRLDDCVRNSRGENVTLVKIPPSPPPRRMKNDCCNASIRLMREIHTHLGIPELRDKGVKFPNRLMATGGKGYTKVDTVLDFLELIVREIDHLGIHPHEIKIKDAKPGIKGDQPVTEEYINATAWAKKLMQANIKSLGEGDARLHLQVRLARLLLETFVTCTADKYKTDAIASFLGVPLQEDVVSPDVPFDVTLGLRKVKGFGTQPTDKDKIKKLAKEDVLKLLDKFLSEVQQDVSIERFDSREQSLLELLQQLVQQT